MIWLFKTHPWTVATGALVFLIAAAGVIYAIIRKGNWKDRGFMERDGKKLLLPKDDLPWTIQVEANVPVIYVDALNTVVLMIKDKIGFIFDQVVQLQPGETPIDIKVLVALDSTITVPGETKPQYDKRTGEILSAFVSMSPGMVYGEALKVALHEIGHVMGLDHDEHISSIMHHMLQHRPQTFTINDVERLKKAYGLSVNN